MKKIIALLALVPISLAVSAQDQQTKLIQQYYFTEEIFRSVSIISTVIIFMIFVITLLKMFFDNRLKHKIVDKGIQESVAASILQTTPKNDQQSTIKWACLLGGLGAGLFIVNYTQPLGIHSIGIMALSLSASFIIYYFLIKTTSK
ncbi:MAG: hypothetical protein IPP79_11865 [Chitinophagaceae bacterium]|nr:hypothetical protein [Chitinophagaceae bacterium]